MTNGIASTQLNIKENEIVDKSGNANIRLIRTIIVIAGFAVSFVLLGLAWCLKGKNSQTKGRQLSFEIQNGILENRRDQERLVPTQYA